MSLHINIKIKKTLLWCHYEFISRRMTIISC